MAETKFEITISQKGLAGFIVSFVFVKAILILMSFEDNLVSSIIAKVLLIVFFVMCVAAAIFKPLLFKVQMAY